MYIWTYFPTSYQKMISKTLLKKLKLNIYQFYEINLHCGKLYSTKKTFLENGIKRILSLNEWSQQKNEAHLAYVIIHRPIQWKQRLVMPSPQGITIWPPFSSVNIDFPLHERVKGANLPQVRCLPQRTRPPRCLPGFSNFVCSEFLIQFLSEYI